MIVNFDEVDVIEVLVSPGESIEANQSIVTLESDKAMMEFPVTDAGVVKSINVSVGDKIKQGDPLLVLEVASDQATSEMVMHRFQGPVWPPLMWPDWPRC